MHDDTGEIKEVNKLTDAEVKSGKWKEIGQRPNAGCKHCHGRGFVGWRKGKVVKCKCVKFRPIKK